MVRRKTRCGTIMSVKMECVHSSVYISFILMIRDIDWFHGNKQKRMHTCVTNHTQLGVKPRNLTPHLSTIIWQTTRNQLDYLVLWAGGEVGERNGSPEGV